MESHRARRERFRRPLTMWLTAGWHTQPSAPEANFTTIKQRSCSRVTNGLIDQFSMTKDKRDPRDTSETAQHPTRRSARQSRTRHGAHGGGAVARPGVPERDLAAYRASRPGDGASRRVPAAPSARDRSRRVGLNRHFFSARAGNAPRDPRASTSTAPLPAQRARGVSARHPDSVRPPPIAPDRPQPRPRARRPALHAAPRSPYPPSSPDASARQETLAPSRASTDGPTPWSVTRGVVVGVAFGALVIAGGALVSTSSTEFGAEFQLSSARVSPASSSASAPETRARVEDADAFSLPSFERDARTGRPRWRTPGAPRPRRAAARCSAGTARARRLGRGEDALVRRARREAPNASREDTKKENEKNARLKTRAAGDLEGDLEGDAELLEATLAFAKPRPEDARERQSARAPRGKKPRPKRRRSSFDERRRRFEPGGGRAGTRRSGHAPR